MINTGNQQTMNFSQLSIARGHTHTYTHTHTHTYTYTMSYTYTRQETPLTQIETNPVPVIRLAGSLRLLSNQKHYTRFSLSLSRLMYLYIPRSFHPGLKKDCHPPFLDLLLSSTYTHIMQCTQAK